MHCCNQNHGLGADPVSPYEQAAADATRALEEGTARAQKRNLAGLAVLGVALASLWYFARKKR